MHQPIYIVNSSLKKKLGVIHFEKLKKKKNMTVYVYIFLLINSLFQLNLFYFSFDVIHINKKKDLYSSTYLHCFALYILQ